MSPTSYQAALPRVIPSLLSATLIIIPYSNGFVKRVRKVFLQRKQRMKTRLLTFFPENQQPRQFTPLREGRQMCRAGQNKAQSYFNSRPSARGDVGVMLPFSSCSLFQFTPLREGRRTPITRNFAPSYFNSRPSARGDDFTETAAMMDKISIHAPPRGATAKDMQFLQIFCSTLTNQHGLTIVPRNLSRLFW